MKKYKKFFKSNRLRDRLVKTILRKRENRENKRQLEKHLLEKYKTLPITNNFMFGKVMSDKETCKMFLETMLKIKIENLVYIENEVTKKIMPDSKGVRYDVYVKDSDRIFDIEMQMIDTKELPLRSRYYQSVMDIDNLLEGDDYESIKESYVIFICPVDIFSEKLPVYVFENRCVQKLDLKLNDKTQKIYYNFSEYQKETDKEVKGLLKYFSTGESETKLTDRLKSKLLQAHTNSAWGAEYMIYEMDLKQKYKQGVEQGIVQGIEQGRELAHQEFDVIIAEKDEQLTQKDETIFTLSNRIRELEALIETQ